ncbi:DNA-binding transcriptional LysR family regulator [Novosphingobium capsulatum]|uniref:DNA-binding transcriptional LysR family regulator n=1 Tax=Novosphingobium capsulatum TaxID=13688 RepID=A0ABU1ML63_9SPHN|nr:LysR family transcriptional regulator [Novosphingobium capsulatum]MDR6511085.1 DNA-binding transcriptional LysR family regulator [Novosphingobium capsulatum]
MDMFAALQAFVAVVDEGGFAPAARRAGQATSSFTRHVDALEAALGTRLLTRTTRQVSLTEAGEAYYPRARAILDTLAEANRTVREGPGAARGLLRVSLPVSFARLHVTPILPAFMAAHPDITLDVVVTDTPLDLATQRIDVAVRLGALDSSSLVARRLAPQRRLVCASPAYLAAHGTPQVPQDLADHACLTFAFADGERRWRLTRDGQHEWVRVSGPLRANHADTIRETALAGAGLVLLPTWLVGEDVAQGRLRPVLAEWHGDIARPGAPPPGDPGIHALYLADRRGMSKVRLLVDFLAESFGTPPYWERCLPG